MISKDVLTFDVKIPESDVVVQNRQLYHAEEDYKLLCRVNEDPTLFTSGVYSMLANTFERMYKGFAIELQKLHPEHNFHLENIDDNHFIASYAQQVNKFCPIASNREAYYVTLENHHRIYNGYTNSKYTDIYEYSDFEKDFKRLEIQRSRVGRCLSAEIIRNRCSDVMNIENINREDLDLI